MISPFERSRIEYRERDRYADPGRGLRLHQYHGYGIGEGTEFFEDYADSSSIIITETTAKMLGWEDPIGKQLYGAGQNPGDR